MSDTYNGWTNYETWAVKLWIDNEEASYRYWNERAAEHAEDPYGLSRELKEEHEAALPELSGFAADLLNAALSEVNWYEIAESLIEGAKDNEDDEDGTDDEKSTARP